MNPVLTPEISFIQGLPDISGVATRVRFETCLPVRLAPGPGIAGKTPSAKTVWKYRELFVRHGLSEQCFGVFRTCLTEHFSQFREDNTVIIASSFIPVPVQRNTREDNQIIRAGGGWKLWTDKPRKKRKRVQAPAGQKKAKSKCSLARRMSWCRV